MIKSGEIVQVKDSAYDGLTGLTIYGNTRQNLWQNPSGTVGGITVTSNSDGSMTLSGSHDSTVVIKVNTHILKPNTAYVLSGDKKPPTGTYFCVANPVGAAYKTGFGAFTTGSDVDGCVFAFVMQAAIAGGVEMSGTYRVMLREATAEEIQALAQMPVTIPEGGTEDIPQDHPMLFASGDDDFGWCPPGLNSVGDDGSVKVVTAGKNLLARLGPELPYTTQGITFSDNGDGGIRISGTASSIAYYTFYNLTNKRASRITSGTYVASLVGGIKNYMSLSVQYYDDEVGGSYTSWLATHATRLSNTGRIDRPVYLRAFLGVASGTTVDAVVYPQLELGSTATDYEPPNITTTSIDLQGHTLNALPDGTRDELHIDGGGNVVLEKRVAARIATKPGVVGATADRTNYTTSNSEGSIPWDRIEDANTGNKRSRCDKFPAFSGGKDRRIGYYNASPSSTVNLISVFSGNADNASKTVGDGQLPITLLYACEPQTIDLGTVDLPKLQKLDVNTVYVTDDTPATIDVEYNRYRSGCDGFKVDGKHNYWDMRACLASRDTGVPEKKLSTVTVPYMSGFYDLSKLYGAIAFESREVTYTIEFVEDTTEELQARKSAILQWLSMVHDADIFDDDFPGYHFHGSYSDASWEEDDSGLQGSLEITFLCHPFLVADSETSVSLSAGERTVTVEGQPVNAYAVCASGSAAVKFRGVQQSVGTTPVRLSAQLQPGDNAVTVTGSAVTLTWNEERV